MLYLDFVNFRAVNLNETHTLIGGVGDYYFYSERQGGEREKKKRETETETETDTERDRKTLRDCCSYLEEQFRSDE